MKITGGYSEIPLHAASVQRARAAGLPVAPRPAAATPPSLDARAAAVRDVATLRPAEAIAPTQRAEAPAAASRLERLVAATVPGRMDFDDPRVTSATSLTTGAGGGAFSMYTRPGDKNAAATAVSVGRSLDIQG